MAWGAGATKRSINRPHSSSQEATEDSGRLRNQARGMSTRAIGSQFAMTLLSPPASLMASAHIWMNCAGSAAPSYHGGNPVLNFGGHRTLRKAEEKARWPAAPSNAPS